MAFYKKSKPTRFIDWCTADDLQLTKCEEDLGTLPPKHHMGEIVEWDDCPLVSGKEEQL